jgi:hypothetical protein
MQARARDAIPPDSRGQAPRFCDSVDDNMIPCGDRDGRRNIPWVRNPRLLTRSPAGIGMGVATFLGFGTHGY